MIPVKNRAKQMAPTMTGPLRPQAHWSLPQFFMPLQFLPIRGLAKRMGAPVAGQARPERPGSARSGGLNTPVSVDSPPPVQPNNPERWSA
jgi:hypothetical protein